MTFLGESMQLYFYFTVKPRFTEFFIRIFNRGFLRFIFQITQFFNGIYGLQQRFSAIQVNLSLLKQYRYPHHIEGTMMSTALSKVIQMIKTFRMEELLVKNHFTMQR